MSGSPSFCGICDIRHISKPSEMWCPDCEEGICTECKEYHSLAKPCRNHTTIPIEEYQKIPSFVLEIKEHCDEHHEKFMGGDRSATVIWACLSLFLTKFISQGFDSTTTSPNI
jgi:hypothetical protein